MWLKKGLKKQKQLKILTVTIIWTKHKTKIPITFEFVWLDLPGVVVSLALAAQLGRSSCQPCQSTDCQALVTACDCSSVSAGPVALPNRPSWLITKSRLCFTYFSALLATDLFPFSFVSELASTCAPLSTAIRNSTFTRSVFSANLKLHLPLATCQCKLQSSCALLQRNYHRARALFRVGTFDDVALARHSPLL